MLYYVWNTFWNITEKLLTWCVLPSFFFRWKKMEINLWRGKFRWILIDWLWCKKNLRFSKEVKTKGIWMLLWVFALGFEGCLKIPFWFIKRNQFQFCSDRFQTMIMKILSNHTLNPNLLRYHNFPYHLKTPEKCISLQIKWKKNSIDLISLSEKAVRPP